jgi:hypothetical protein
MWSGRWPWYHPRGDRVTGSQGPSVQNCFQEELKSWSPCHCRCHPLSSDCPKAGKNYVGLRTASAHPKSSFLTLSPANGTL